MNTRSKQTNKRNVMAAVLVATFLSAIEGTIVTTAMPKIVSDLGGVEAMSWVVSIYLLTTVISTPIYGKASDLFGRKIVFTFGSSVFLLGSMLSGMSQTMTQLIVFRAIQGLGAGALLPVTHTIIGDIFEYEQRAKMQGLLSVIWGIAGVLGPLTGGLIVDYISWHWIFYLNLPFGLIAMVLLWISLHENFEKQKRHIDYWGIITFSLSMALLLFALLQGGTAYAWNSNEIISLLSAALVIFLIFIWIELKSPEPMLPLQLFKMRIIWVVNSAGFLLSAILVAIDFYIPLWVQGVYGEGATYSGMMLIPMTLSWTLGSMMVGRVIGRWGLRSIILFGMIALVLGTCGLIVVSIDSPHWLLAGFAAICGLGFGSAFTSHTVSIQSTVDWRKRGIAIGSNSFVRVFGQVLGIAVFGSFLNSRIASELVQHGMELGDADLNDALQYADSNLPESVLHLFRDALANGLHGVFIVLAVLAVIALMISIAMPRVKYETSESAAARVSDTDAGNGV